MVLCRFETDKSIDFVFCVFFANKFEFMFDLNIFNHLFQLFFVTKKKIDIVFYIFSRQTAKKNNIRNEILL